MNKLIIFLIVCSLSTPAYAAWQGKKPCSGKKGGISHCVGTKFMCKNGTISKSKKKCSGR